MTATTPEYATPPAYTAPTVPVTPASSTEAPTGAPPADRAPWYRRAWVLIVGAVLLALLSFGSGFIAGSAVSLFDGLFGGASRGVIDGGPGFPDGVRPGDGQLPPFPGDPRSDGTGS